MFSVNAASQFLRWKRANLPMRFPTPLSRSGSFLVRDACDRHHRTTGNFGAK
jgi:hypothetical protein